jgi:ABC-type glycerol-3-phosphate transport system substrate-binding protein
VVSPTAEVTEWSSLAKVSLATSAAVACLVLGLLAGVTAAGGRPNDVLHVFRIQAAKAKQATRASHAAPTPVANVSVRTVTHTVTVTSAPSPPPAATVVQTVTETAPAVTVTVTSPGSSTGG